MEEVLPQVFTHTQCETVEKNRPRPNERNDTKVRVSGRCAFDSLGPLLCLSPHLLEPFSLFLYTVASLFSPSLPPTFPVPSSTAPGREGQVLQLGLGGQGR